MIKKVFTIALGVALGVTLIPVLIAVIKLALITIILLITQVVKTPIISLGSVAITAAVFWFTNKP